MLFIVTSLLLCLLLALNTAKECAGGWLDTGKRVPYFGIHKSRNDYKTTARDTNRNGYFLPWEAAGWCMLYDNLTHVAETDFRNRLAERYLVPANIPRIEVAEALYSQYDTHLDGDSVLLKRLMDPADCTHYCARSGVLRYIHRMIYNAVFDV